jgi:hypothetical protein
MNILAVSFLLLAIVSFAVVVGDFTSNKGGNKMSKEALLDELYEVFKNTENEEVFQIVGNVIDFIKREIV